MPINLRYVVYVIFSFLFPFFSLLNLYVFWYFHLFLSFCTCSMLYFVFVLFVYALLILEEIKVSIYLSMSGSRSAWETSETDKGLLTGFSDVFSLGSLVFVPSPDRVVLYELSYF